MINLLPRSIGLTATDIKLLYRFFVNAVRDRILGSTLGLVWIALSPILMLSIFTYVFVFVFKSKLPGSEQSLSYVIWLISGYGPWLSISEAIAIGTTSVVSNTGLLKNISFKAELLPLSYSLMGLIPLAISLLYLIILLFFDPSLTFFERLGSFPLMVASLIPIIFCQVVLTAGICLFLSAVNVFLRDVALVLPNLLLIILFASPIFYSLSILPSAIQKIMWFNPFFLVCEGYRMVILEHSFLSAGPFLYLVVISSLVYWGGLRFFRSLKGYFDSRI